MITPTPNTKIYIHTGKVDFRKGIDGLCAICKYDLKKTPFNGTMFVFSNSSRTALKILYFDGQGYWICHKRLSRGRFNWWPKGELAIEFAAKELIVLMWNGDPYGSKMQSDWRPIS